MLGPGSNHRLAHGLYLQPQALCDLPCPTLYHSWAGLFSLETFSFGTKEPASQKEARPCSRSHRVRVPSPRCFPALCPPRTSSWNIPSCHRPPRPGSAVSAHSHSLFVSLYGCLPAPTHWDGCPWRDLAYLSWHWRHRHPAPTGTVIPQIFTGV